MDSGGTWHDGLLMDLLAEEVKLAVTVEMLALATPLGLVA